MKTKSTPSSAPKLSLLTNTGKVFDLKNSKSKALVLFFYPKDLTPGCTIEAKGFTKAISKFKKLGAEVVGISGGSVESKAKFCSKEKLGVTLLADEDFAVAKKFGVYGPKTFMGRKYMGIHRVTFVIGKGGKIIKVFENVTPDTHPEEVLEFLKEKLEIKKPAATRKIKANKPKRILKSKKKVAKSKRK